MSWGSRAFRRISNAVSSPSQIGNTLLATAQAPLAPVAYLGGLQQGGWQGGTNAVNSLAGNNTDFWANPDNQQMMALTAAQITAAAATGGLAAGGGSLGLGYTAGGFGGVGMGTLGLTGGTAIAATGALQAENIAKATSGSGAGDIPPDLMDMYKNDPAQAQQFMRLRRAAQQLGRAGTIKAKGSASLGGDQPLGTNLALTGA